jgi:WD40 repeat protein
VLAATGPTNTTVTLWDVSDPQHPRYRSTFRATSSDTYEIVFDPTGQRMAVVGNGDSGTSTVQVWDVENTSAPVLKESLSVTSATSSVAFTPSGGSLIVGGGDGVTVYDADPRNSPTACAPTPVTP